MISVLRTIARVISRSAGALYDLADALEYRQCVLQRLDVFSRLHRPE